MNDQGAYKGSMAFNQSILLQENVDPNTGSFSLSKSLVHLKGINETINLSIDLHYINGAEGVLGLPNGWTFNVPYVVPNKTLSVGGTTYIIDLNWADEFDYKSGLRYVNNHGIKFEVISPAQPLPSGKPGEYSYQYTESDGSKCYFDSTGKLLEFSDLYGNYNYYSYNDQFQGVYGNYITEIQDSYGQIVTFNYSPNQITVSLPNSKSLSLSYSPNGIELITDELGYTTSLSYGEISGSVVVEQIIYPTGLYSRLTYTSLAYRSSGGESAFPAVSTLTHLDMNNVFMASQRYAYGLNTNGNTFTGYNAGYLLSNDDDGLMDSNNTSYTYDVTESKLDEAGEILTYTTYNYNYLHSLVHKDEYLLDENRVSVDCYRTEYTYEISVDWHARTTNYNKPTTSEILTWLPSKNAYSPLRKTLNSYNNFGHALTAETRMYDSSSEQYISQSLSTNTYVIATWGGEMPASSITQDVISDYEQQTTFTLTRDEKNIATKVLVSRNSSDDNWSPWKNHAFSYDEYGRVLSDALSWSAGAENPNSDLQSTNTSYAYLYNSTDHKLTVTKTDALDNTSSNIYDVSYPGLILLESTNPVQQTTKFSYDAFSRPTSTTDPLGNTETTHYDCYQASGSNRIQITIPSGYITEVYCDGLGREIKLMDNGDGSGGINRVVGQNVYNGLGFVESSAGILGLTTDYQYDAMGRQISKSDPHQNVTTIAYNDAEQTTITSINGVQQEQQIKDNMGRISLHKKYANPDDKNIDYYLNQSFIYNGISQITGQKLDRISLSSSTSTTLRSYAKEYDADGKISKAVFSGFDSKEVEATKAFNRDLFGNVYSFSKNVNYLGGSSFRYESGQSFYDSCNRLQSNINALGQSETYAHYPDGKKKSYIRFDGTAINYQYDDNGNIFSISSGDLAYNYRYDVNNKIDKITSGDDTLSYTYHIDGQVNVVTYPDGKTQTSYIDGKGRLVKVEDFSGSSTSMTYNEVGQIVGKVIGSSELTFEYGTANALKGVLVSTSISGKDNLNYKITYDGFGRVGTNTATKKEENDTLFSCAYTYGPTNRLSRVENIYASQTGQTSIISSFEFDGIDQVINEEIDYQGGERKTSTSYSYDANSNVLSKSVDGVTTDYTYNKIDQLTTQGIKYDVNGRITEDAEGNQYTYDIFDKLLSTTIKPSGDEVNYTYNPDSLLSQRALKSNTETFYYHNGTANLVNSATSSSDTEEASAGNWQKYIFQGKSRLACLTDDDNQKFLFGANSSTAGVYDGNTISPMQYEAYGVESGEQQADTTSFSWKQEYMDRENELVYLRSRFYNPDLMRFMTMDTYGLSNRYAFGNGNPIDNIDPTGHMSEGAALGIGIGVGLIATVVTGGALGVAVGTDIAASMAVGAVAGAVGSVAGDATTAGLSGQKFTAERAMIDIGAGLAGGAVGAGVGGAVGRSAMSYALGKGLSRGMVTVSGALSAGLTGGIAGAAAASGVTSLATKQPFFSSATALNLAIGAAAGVGGGLLASGAHLGMLGSAGGSDVAIMPVEANLASNFDLQIEPGPNNERIFDFSPSDNDNLNNPNLTQNNRDAVVIHGFARHVFPEVTIGGENFTQYMTPEAFADLLRANGFGNRDINLWSCFAAKLRCVSVAQRLATALNVNVYAPSIRDSVTLGYVGNWIRYTP